jgi:hypothetical protein
MYRYEGFNTENSITYSMNCNYRIGGTLYTLETWFQAQVVPVLCDLALMRFENLHHFSNLCNNFKFDAIWHRSTMDALIFCRRLATSDVTVMPPATCTD